MLPLTYDYSTKVKEDGKKCVYKFAFIASQCSLTANQAFYERLYRRHFMKFCHYFTFLFFENKATSSGVIRDAVKNKFLKMNINVYEVLCIYKL